MSSSNQFPYHLHPREPFHLKTIPVFGMEERIDFFYKYKRASENLYIGNIDKSNFSFDGVHHLYDSINLYFKEKYFLDAKEEIVLDELRKIVFPKLCWLTDSFFKTGFKFPISAHYNPRIQNNVVHPGTGRYNIIRLFQDTEPVKCLYFNTGGVHFDFMDSLDPFTRDDLVSYQESLELELVADHGSIIPHINLNVPEVWAGIKTWQDFIHRRLTSPTFTIFTNLPVPMLNPWVISENEATVKIYFQSALTPELICKSIILAVNGKNYTSDKLIVEHTLTFNTPA